MSTQTTIDMVRERPDVAWEIAPLLPAQGEWDWVVNPETETIIVLRLEHERYAEHGEFKRGETAASALLEGFTASVDAVLDAK
jgi:hypothetical protein